MSTTDEIISNKSERQIDIDIAKAFGIILVVIGHVVGSGFLAAKLYHMPLFFFISGLTLKIEKPFGETLKKRITRLYIPFVLYETVFVLLNYPFYRIGIVSEQMNSVKSYLFAAGHIILFDNISILLAPIWFLTALFYALIASSLLLKAIKRIIKDERIRIVLQFVIAIAFIYLGMTFGHYGLLAISWSYNFQQCINVVIMSTGYLMMGYNFRQLSNKCNQKKDIKIFGCIFVSLLFVALIVFERITHLKADMRSNAYDYIPLQPIFALVGITEIFILSRLFIKLFESWAKILIKVFEYIGLHTFSIMCLHPIAFKLISLIQVYVFKMDKSRLPDWQLVSNNPIWLCITIVAGLTIPLIFDYLFSCFKKRGTNNVDNG